MTRLGVLNLDESRYVFTKKTFERNFTNGIAKKKELNMLVFFLLQRFSKNVKRLGFSAVLFYVTRYTKS